MKANPSMKTLHDRKLVVLDQKNSEIWVNGIAFANYLLVLKNVVKKVNQDFEINPNIVGDLKASLTA
jgi:putative SOS response-associated peptidase YedK